MKLPQAQYNRGVESLAKKNIAQEGKLDLSKAEVNAAKINAVGKPLIAAGKLYDNYRATEAARESVLERQSVADAYDENTGLIDVSMLSDDVYKKHMTNPNLSAQSDKIDGDRRLTQLHNVTDFLADEFKASEKKRTGRMQGNTQRLIYEEQEKGAGEKYLQSLLLKGKNSLISATRNMNVETIQIAAANGDVEGVLDTLETLSSVSPPKAVEKVREVALTQLKEVKSVQLQNDAEIAYQASFDGSDDEVAAAAQARSLELEALVAQEVITAEEKEQADYDFQNRVRLESDKGDLKYLYDNKGREAAIDYVQKAYRSTGTDSDQGDEYGRAEKLDKYFNQLDRHEKAKSEASSRHKKDLIKGYYETLTNNKDAAYGTAFDDENVRAKLNVMVSKWPEDERVEAHRIMDLAEKLKSYSSMSTDEFNRTIAADLDQYSDIEDYKNIAATKQFANERIKAIKDDPLAYFASSFRDDTGSLLPPEATYFNYDDPVGSIERIAETARMAEAHLGVPVSRLPKPMLEQLSMDIADGTASVAQQTSVLTAISSLPDAEQLPTMRALAETGNGFLATASMMLGEGKNVASLLKGQDALRHNPDLMKKGREAGSFQDQLVSKGFYQAYGDSPAAYVASIREAVLAQYIYNTGGIPSDDWKGDKLKEAIEFVTNGFLNINGHKVPRAFKGQTEEQLEYQLRELTDVDIQSLGGTKMNSDTLKNVLKNNGRLVPTGGKSGRYYVEYFSTETNLEVFAPNASGGNFILDLNELGGNYIDPNFTPPPIKIDGTPQESLNFLIKSATPNL